MMANVNGEEKAELLTPSHSGHGLASKSKFRGRIPLSPTTISTMLSGPNLTIVGLIAGAAFVSVVHHFFLVFLRGRRVEEQFWMKNTSNALSIVVQSLCAVSVSVSLTQLIWWFLRRRPFTVSQLNQLFSLPGQLPTLFLVLSKRPWRILPIIFISALIPVYTLVSILAPNALAVGPASPKTQIISAPTIFFDRDPLEQGWAYPLPSVSGCIYEVTSSFERVLERSLRFDGLVGWSAPLGCESGCNYTLQYSAPALRCSSIDAEDILNGSSTIHPAQPPALLWSNDSSEGVYNGASQYMRSDVDIAISWRKYSVGGDLIFGSMICYLFNTTQQSTVSFSNNTGIILPSIISYNERFDGGFTPQMQSQCNERQTLEMSPTLSYYVSYLTILSWLQDQLDGYISYLKQGKQWYKNSDVISTGIFVINETATTFTPRDDDVKKALEQILVNVTIALISAGVETTEVNATVTQDYLVWVYDARRLWMTYATALALTFVCGAIGLACIVKNGEVRDLAFLDIVRATRNVELDSVFGENTVENATELQYRVEWKDEQRSY
ncbi:uncharacterized protein EV420DRAFT_1555814 [Desarmillaria tabescens]|uniref:Uncharacterized protein n=1 Tax=Armillaria tabescens TaxID=1929756 RepID=A0AA39N1R6_ARMTA|nr:uncharacterized protein EV420DRAFT_1555814 [Desarmillaria tabescens]KAK0454219.1 hypothetical protein EV420DRAFT_1555814 [Desarmillaria tabescens]